MPEWSKGAACKAVIRGFKSRSALDPDAVRRTMVGTQPPSLANEEATTVLGRYSQRSGTDRSLGR